MVVHFGRGLPCFTGLAGVPVELYSYYRLYYCSHTGCYISVIGLWAKHLPDYSGRFYCHQCHHWQCIGAADDGAEPGVINPGGVYLPGVLGVVVRAGRYVTLYSADHGGKTGS